MAEKSSILGHFLVPKHEIITKAEEEKLFESLGIQKNGLPKIYVEDPAIKEIGAKEGEVVKITREDATAKNAYYRLVVK